MFTTTGLVHGEPLRAAAVADLGAEVLRRGGQGEQIPSLGQSDRRQVPGSYQGHGDHWGGGSPRASTTVRMYLA